MTIDSLSSSYNQIPAAPKPKRRSHLADSNPNDSPINLKIDPKILKDAYEKPKNILNRFANSSFNVFKSLKKKIERTDLVPIISSLHSNLNEAEVVLNVVACLPIIGGLGMALKILIGKVQVIAGALITAMSDISIYSEAKKEQPFHPFRNGDYSNKLVLLSKLGRELIVHGSLNVVRGASELALFNLTMGMGNILLLAPNLINRRDFKPFVPYGILTKIVATPSKSRSSSALSKS